MWDEVIEMGEQHGFRNAQATVLAPTGTIGFMMDCDTTGVEPDIALVKYKKLVGGGMMKIVNQTVPMALKKLGYTPAADQGDHRVHRRERDHRGRAARQGAAPGGVRLRVQADARHAVDPLHGAHPDDGRRRSRSCRARSRKTVNVPKDATVEDIQQAYIDSWRHRRQGGVDLPRRLQAHAAAATPRSRRSSARRADAGAAVARRPASAASCRTSATRSPTSSTSPATRATSPSASTRTACRARSSSSWRRKARPSRGFADAFAQAISYALQYGVPLQDLVDKFSHVRFEPSGMTRNPDVRFAKSIVDYIFRWMAAKFLSPEAQFRAGVNNREEVTHDAGAAAAGREGDAPRRPSPPACLRRRRSRRSRTRKTRRRARPAARSWCAAAPATSAQLRHDERLRVTLDVAQAFRPACRNVGRVSEARPFFYTLP